ncbi:hypothetical protein CGCSCA4_v003269 [Colletotrichum siamense]|uniref:Uncharacterized protein n=1 Tax=Colletotrichum siamense TaxID=690259 RepID=A0A9P5ETY8_COLSI|nr:uncharacterized protein CGCS363_v003623 [Colletotrichum siamense]KAF4851787.1 hypothetical protein CGCSCA4_v003269 [Colletotrichum siamense]KAF4859257.1 hypothetical protein CGCSCA2_v006345 [Colletotrichum siamense]KAF5510757.1 hypothetical protein CGCS363_v003623 [Colletotrichum siamense]
MSVTTTATAPSSCPTNEIPEGLPIPNNVTYAVIPGHNASDPWMVNCCSPNPVHLVNDCWEWCEVPEATKKNRDDAQIVSVFGSCLRAEGRNSTESNGVQVRSASSYRPVPFAGLLLAALAACTLGLVV